MLPLVIVNAESAHGATGTAWPKMASDLRTHFGAFATAFTAKAGGGVELAGEAAKRGRQLIIACGGDGTISQVANGILASGIDCELGILPSGTGGDFRKTLRIPNRATDAARILRVGQTRKIDVGRISFIGHDGAHQSRYFLGVASFGLSAEVVERVGQRGSKWWPNRLGGKFSFAVSMLDVAMRLPAMRVVVEWDDQGESHHTITTLCVANARYFGGGMKIAPEANLTDGQFDVVSIGDLGALQMVTNAPRIYLGSHLSMEQIRHARARKVFARPARKDEHIALEVDGELPGRLPATFQVWPKALRVRCPQ
jgi:diacylglycerol kinase (ATP)